MFRVLSLGYRVLGLGFRLTPNPVNTEPSAACRLSSKELSDQSESERFRVTGYPQTPTSRGFRIMIFLLVSLKALVLVGLRVRFIRDFRDSGSSWVPCRVPWG